MKNFITITLFMLLLSSCSSPKMVNSIWSTLEPVQNGDNDGLRITSLYMYEDGNVEVYKSIVADSGMVVAPFLFAKGAYKLDGNTKKEAAISVSGTDKNNQNFDWTGLIDLKNNSMMLIESGSSPVFYCKYGNLTIE